MPLLYLGSEAGAGLSLLLEALLEGEFVEFAAGLLLAATFTLGFIVIALFVAAPTAFAFVTTMSLFEARRGILQKLWTWGLLGGVFAIPLGLWVAWPSARYESEGPIHWNLLFLCLYVGSGFAGGIAAWFGYYRPIRSDP